jgi:ribulose-phosphate 3-epimerase
MLALKVLPAVIPRSLDHLCEAIAAVLGKKAPRAFLPDEIQIDIVDGIFVPHKSWPYREGALEESIPLLADAVPSGLSFELDLMIAEPLAGLPLWLATGPESVVLHIESFDGDADIKAAVEMVRAGGVSAALSARNDTPIERLSMLASGADGIQCMGIAEIGRQGNPFDERVLERIRVLREQYPALPIGVDGSVNAETIVRLKEAGANRFVAGSAIFDAPNPRAAYRRLADLVAS